MSVNHRPGFLSFLFPRPKKQVKSSDPENLDGLSITFPYEINDCFLSQSEHSFYLVAQRVLGSRYMICPKVSLSAVFSITDPKFFSSAFTRISRKQIDFIICNAVTMKILFGIELDDSTNQRTPRMETNEFVNTIFQAAHLPLVHIKARSTYNITELERLFGEVLDSAETAGAGSLPESAQPSTAKADHSTCPNCGAPMTVRVSTSGPNVGSEFYVCSKYPNCKTHIKVESEKKE